MVTHAFAQQLPGMVAAGRGEEQPDPRLIVLNEPLARALGLEPGWLRSTEGIGFLLGRGPDGAHAMVYAGFQFGQFNPRMGDGRALLLGEARGPVAPHNPEGVWDLHAKGIGRTAWSRPGADGRGTLRSMLREYLMSEAMHALGVPTTRGLAVISTGRKIQRHIVEPAGVHVRVAASHIRIGSFHYAAHTGQLKELADYTIARHFPGANYREVYQKAMAAQIRTVAAWQRLGFIHGVMNTDNTTLSGETIDYGPCAFLETFEPETWFSSIDTQGRYRFGNQPAILGWNFARLGESMLPLFDADPNSAVAFAQEAMDGFTESFAAEYHQQLATALDIAGLDFKAAGAELVDGYLEAMVGHDLTAVNATLNEGGIGTLGKWERTWGSHNPRPHFHRVIPRARNVEAALDDAAEFQRLLHAATHPYEPNERYERPGDLTGYQTFCGT